MGYYIEYVDLKDTVSKSEYKEIKIKIRGF